MVSSELAIGQTIAGARYRVDRLLQGDGEQRLFLGTDLQGESPVMIALDLKPSRIDHHDIAALRASIAYEAAGILTLEYVGEAFFLESAWYWAVIERVPAGSWLPSLLGVYSPAERYQPVSSVLPLHDPDTAVQNALSLGRSAGRILADAAAKGIILPLVHPELMWAQRGEHGLEVTGLTQRPHALFARTTIDAFSSPLFDRLYRAPEAYDDPDDRALVFALSIMIAEWATGRFPFHYKHHGSGPLEGKHLKLKLSKPLATLLSRGMRLERKQRPNLAAFLRELSANA
jgi:hypothetical protein